jgi:atypical dual specificity phosphatase
MLPPFPKIKHLPFSPNMGLGDVVADFKEISDVLTDSVIVEEKIDGSHCGMMYDGNAIIRNKDHILKKGYLKNTPAKMQFRPAWNWLYDNKDKFIKLNKTYDYPLGVYGEWVYAVHGLIYDKLPSLFIAYEVYDPEIHSVLEPKKSREILKSAGFSIPHLIFEGKIDPAILETWCHEQSFYSTDQKREGIVVKTSTERFKKVRSDFVQGALWDKEKLTKQYIMV